VGLRVGWVAAAADEPARCERAVAQFAEPYDVALAGVLTS
jgi:hypothetical protein